MNKKTPLLQATGQEIEKAVNAGFLAPKTLTGLARYHLGSYEKLHFKRLDVDVDGHARGAQTSLNQEKRKLIQEAQEKLIRLGELERCIGLAGYKPKDILDLATKYLKGLETKGSFNQFLKTQSEAFLDGKDGPTKINTFGTNISKLTMPEDLKSYIRDQAQAILAYSSQLNRDLVAKSGSLNWGELNNSIEDALQAVTDYNFPMTASPDETHDLRFKDSQKTYQLRLSDYCPKAQDQNELRLLNRYLNFQNPEEIPTLSPLKSSKWNFALAWKKMKGLDQPWIQYQSNLKKAAAIFLSPLARLADNLIGFFTGLGLGRPFDYFRKNLDQWTQKTDGLSENARREKIIAESLSHPSILNRFGTLIHSGAKHFGESLFALGKGVYGIFEGMATEIRLNVKPVDQATLLQSLQSSVVTQNPALGVGAGTSPNTEGVEETKGQAEEQTPNKVRIESPLDPYQTNDLLGLTVSGTKGFVDLFAHNVYAKHPTLGLLFTASYVMGLLPLVAPQLAVKLFGSQYTHLVSALKETTDKGESVLAKAGVAFLTGKLQTSALELVANGPNSWLVKGAHQFSQDPVTISSVLLASYLGGHFFLHGSVAGHHAPGAATLAKETGTIPEFAETLIGAKLFAIFAGLFSSKKEQALSATKETREITEETLKKILKSEEHVSIGRREATAAEVNKIINDLKLFESLPKASRAKKAEICDYFGREHGYNSDVARAARIKAKTHHSYFGNSIQHLFDYLSLIPRLVIALGASILRRDMNPLYRIGAMTKDLLIDSYARVSTNVLRLFSLFANIVVQRAPRVLAGIVQKIETIGIAIFGKKQTEQQADLKVLDSPSANTGSTNGSTKIATYANRSMQLHRFGERAFDTAKTTLKIDKAQCFSQGAFSALVIFDNQKTMAAKAKTAVQEGSSSPTGSVASDES